MKSVDHEPISGILAITRVLAAIPSGCVTSYGEVAARAGLPRRARLVGRILRDTSDQGLPWHRVIRADGRSAFAVGSRPWREQMCRLTQEGVPCVAGRIDLGRYGWQRNADLDAELWGPAPRVRASHAAQ